MKLPPIVTAAGLVLLASPVSLAVAQETGSDDSFDEIVVTGTFIRRSEGFTPASPVQEISKADFEANAPRTVADFLTQLPYSFNTTFTVGRALGSSNGSGSLNLRNLGSDATLVLLNGRRVARDAVTVGNVDVNSLVPQIAIERIDVLKDGGSSLYGSDAGGGVANFLTRRNFQGFEVQPQGDQRASRHDRREFDPVEMVRTDVAHEEQDRDRQQRQIVEEQVGRGEQARDD